MDKEEMRGVGHRVAGPYRSRPTSLRAKRSNPAIVTPADFATSFETAALLSCAFSVRVVPPYFASNLANRHDRWIASLSLAMTAESMVCASAT